MNLLESIISNASNATPAVSAPSIVTPSQVAEQVGTTATQETKTDNVSTKNIAERVEAAFPFEVIKDPLQSTHYQLDTDNFALVRSDTKQLVCQNVVKDRYKPHQTSDVVALVEAASEAFEEDLVLDTHFRGGHYVKLTPSNGARLELNKNDSSFPSLMIKAGYDGKSFSASMGLYRDLCSNLMMIKGVAECHASFRHDSKMKGKIDKLIKMFRKLKDSWKILEETCKKMNSTNVDATLFLNTVFEKPEEPTTTRIRNGRGQTIHRNKLSKVVSRVNRERKATESTLPPISLDSIVKGTQENQATVWELLNGVQGYAQHDQTRKGDSTNFDKILKASEDKQYMLAESQALALIN